MKSLSKLLAILIFSIIGSVSALAGDRLFKELSGLPGVQTVFVGKTMMKLGGGLSGLGSMASNIDSVEVISISNNSSAEKARKLLNKVISDNNLEVLTETTDNKDSVVIYGNTDGDIIKLVVISASEPGEYSIISISGKIPVDQLSTLANSF